MLYMGGTVFSHLNFMIGITEKFDDASFVLKVHLRREIMRKNFKLFKNLRGDIYGTPFHVDTMGDQKDKVQKYT